jgi:DNA-binding transcriptional ArsR family regulator
MTPADQFSALADPTRCRVIELLHERPMPVHELTAAFDISRPAISRHLRVLKDAKLVKEEKQGRENVYSLQRQKLKPMAAWLDRHWNSRLAVKPAKEQAPAPVAKPKPVGVAQQPVHVSPKPAAMQMDLFGL